MHAKRLRLPFFAMLVMATVVVLSQAQAGEVQLTLKPPTTNADGTPLKDLAGYRLHWGQASKSYNATKQVGKEVTSVTIANLDAGKTYYFAAIAFDLAGNESKYSNEVSATIPLVNPTPPDPNDVNLPVQVVTASAWEEPNVPANTHDGALNTRWSAEGDGQWIIYDLGAQMAVNQVAIAWYQGNQRRSFFALEVSLNGTTWTEVYSGESSGRTLNLEPYSFAPVAARYVRIVGYGNSANPWNSITEVQVYGPQNAPQPTCDFANLARCATATASSQWSDSYAPSLAIDGNGSTRWNSASGNVVGAWLALDFGTPTTFDTIVLREAIARITEYTLQYWNGTAWQPLVSGTTIGMSKTHTFVPKTAQRLRLLVTNAITVTTSATPTLYEFEVYGQ